MLALGTFGLAALVAGANPSLEDGRKLYDALRYRAAEARLRLALDVPTSTPEERREAHDLLARSLMAQGRAKEAEQVYSRLLAVDPGAPPPRASPGVKRAFERAKEALYDQSFVRLVLEEAPPDALGFRLVDPWGRVDALVLLTEMEDGSFASSSVEKGGEGGSVAVVPPIGGRTTHVVLEARDAAGATLTSLGSREAPIEVATLSVAPPAPASRLQDVEEPAAAVPGPSIVAVPPPPVEPSAAHATWVPLAAAGLGAVAVGVGAGVYFGPATSDYNAGGAPGLPGDQVQAANQKAHGEFVAADAAMIGGAVVTAVGTLLWLKLR
jgi:hypothetical protein